MDSSEEDFALPLLAEEEGEEEEAAIPKKIRQHFEMWHVFVEFNTTFQNLVNYFSHPLSLKTWKLSDMHALFIINTRKKLYSFSRYSYIKIHTLAILYPNRTKELREI